ncbi:MAG: DUF4214 domain-containing protein [Lachnospiraceae bacterium]|nr:DUF4214 domain-containing protein [Lachnospiraceae bacterium]
MCYKGRRFFHRISILLVGVLTIFLLFDELNVYAEEPLKQQSCNSGMSAPSFSLPTLDGGTITNQTYASKTQLLVFYRGNGQCLNSNYTISELSRSTWINDTDIQVIAVEATNLTKEQTESYRTQYAASSSIVWAYNGNDTLSDYLWTTTMSFSTTYATCFILENGTIVDYWDKNSRAQTCLNELKKYVSIDENPNTSGDVNLGEVPTDNNTYYGITLSPQNITLNVGETVTITADHFMGSSYSYRVNWFNYDPQVIEIANNGVGIMDISGAVGKQIQIKAVAAGKGLVRASLDDYFAVCDIVVKNPSQDISAQLSPSTDDSESINEKTEKSLTSIESFVTRIYQVALNRSPEEAGLQDWSNRLETGQSKAVDIIQGIMCSNEYLNKGKTNGEIVTDCYKAMLDRNPDESGYRDWVGRLDNGMSVHAIFAGFVGSQEFANLCNSYGIQPGSYNVLEPRDQNQGVTAFVARLYTQALGRGYDVDGLNDWTGQINANPSRENVLYVSTTGFLDSQEFVNKNLNNTEYVKVLYRTYLGREYDDDGLADWVGQLDCGENTRDGVAAGFAYSKEFNDIMSQYGL